MRVLFVDDEAIIREGLHSLIDWQAAGFEECLEAPTAMEAIGIIDQNPPDLVITDVFMPEMSGIEFAKRIKESHPRIRFVILTGYEKFEYAKEAVALGISSYLSSRCCLRKCRRQWRQSSMRLPMSSIIRF